MIKPEYLREEEVFAQDDHITLPFIKSLGLDELATEEEIIEAMNVHLARNGEKERVIYEAPIFAKNSNLYNE